MQQRTGSSNMTIDAYDFGSITIDGRRYSHDLKIVNATIFPDWWRGQGHRLFLADISELKKFRPRLLLVGTGYAGNMAIMDEVKEYCKENKIALYAAHSKEAVNYFNEIKDQKNIIAAFHLTC